VQTLSPKRQVIRSDRMLSIEEQLLLRLARPVIDDTAAEYIRTLLLADLNWSLLLAQSQRHWITMQIYPRLKQFCQASIPATIMAQLETAHFANTARNLLLATELLDLLQLLTAHGIVAIPFKGPSLAVTAYGQLARRKFSDLDILVSPLDFHQALDLLGTQAGYQRLPTTYHLYAHEYPLVSKTGDVFVDLHQQISGKDFFVFPLSFEEMTQRLQTVTILDVTVPCFHPEDVLLILGVHGSKHCWEQLGWISDFAAFVQAHPHLDWCRIRQRAQVLGCDRMLSIGLSLSHELLCVPLPAHNFRNFERDSNFNALKTQIYQRCFTEISQVTSDPNLEKMILHLQLLDHCWDQIAYLIWCTRRLLTPTYKDIAKIPLPRLLYFLHYLLRPLRLAGLLK